MPTLKEQVENRAKELHNIYYPYFWETQTEEHKKKWIKLAKHCMAAELRAKLEVLEYTEILMVKNQLSALENL